MKIKELLTPLAATAAIAASSAHAAVINLTDLTSTPDGSTTRIAANFDVETLNGGTRVLLPTALNVEYAYIVSTFNFGTGTSADIGFGWDHTSGGVDTAPSRIGIEAQDGGLISMNGGITGSVNAGSLAGQSITIIMKFDYDETRSASNDTIASFWVNPTGSSTEGGADAISSAWNSSNFPELILYIDNESTPGTAGASSITNTKILTGTDATFANALALATVPEPSAALLGGLGALLLLRRRRN